MEPLSYFNENDPQSRPNKPKRLILLDPTHNPEPSNMFPIHGYHTQSNTQQNKPPTPNYRNKKQHRRGLRARNNVMSSFVHRNRNQQKFNKRNSFRANHVSSRHKKRNRNPYYHARKTYNRHQNKLSKKRNSENSHKGFNRKTMYASVNRHLLDKKPVASKVPRINLKMKADIGLNQMHNIKRAILFYHSMEKVVQEEIVKCDLNQDPALRRCNLVHSAENLEKSSNKKNACKKISPTLVHKNCPSNYKRIGCCKCTQRCPNNLFTDKGFYCKKSKPYSINSYTSKEECEMDSKMRCEMWKTDGFIPECKKSFERINMQTCYPHCPDGWSDLGGICQKPGVVDLGDPFPWQEGDE